MASERYELQNLNFDDKSNAKNFIIIPESEPKPFNIPDNIDDIVKVYAGEEVGFICQTAANEVVGLRSTDESIIDKINAIQGVGPASNETLLRID